MYDTLLIVDQYRRFEEMSRIGRKLDPEREAQEINRLIKARGERSRRLAVVSRADTKGRAAYERVGFELTIIDGDRDEMLHSLIARLDEAIETVHPEDLVLVEPDAAFELLCNRVARGKRTKVAVWATRNFVPASLKNYQFRDLEELLPREDKVDVRLDFENLYIGVQQQWGIISPKLLIEAARKALDGLGEIVSIVSYADWGELSKGTGRDLQRELAALGVETRYQISMRGKNSADMKIATDIHTLIEMGANTVDAADVIVLGTRDRDFRPTVETARRRNKKLVLLALREGLSRELEREARDIRFLDPHLPPRTPARGGPHAVQSGLRFTSHSNELAETVLRTMLDLGTRGHMWGDETRLAAVLGAGGAERIRRARDAQLLVPIHTPAGQPQRLKLNPEHPLVKTARYLNDWLPQQIQTYLKVRKWKYVDSSELARRMEADDTLKQLNAGQTRTDADRWLHLASEAGLVVKKSQSHPKSPNVTIHTWWLAEEVNARRVVTQKPDDTAAQAISSQAALVISEPSNAPAPPPTAQPAATSLQPVIQWHPPQTTVTIEGQVRRLLEEGLNDDELRTFAFDHYPDVYDQFNMGMTKRDKALLLVDYVKRREGRGGVKQIIDRVQMINPQHVHLSSLQAA